MISPKKKIPLLLNSLENFFARLKLGTYKRLLKGNILWFLRL